MRFPLRTCTITVMLLAIGLLARWSTCVLADEVEAAEQAQSIAEAAVSNGAAEAASAEPAAEGAQSVPMPLAPSQAAEPRDARATAVHALRILENRCVSCHGEDAQEGELRLDTRDAALRGGSRGPAAVAGEPDASLLIEAVRHKRDGLEMPPEDRLSDAQLHTLARWIELGLPWTRDDRADTGAAEHLVVGQAIAG